MDEKTRELYAAIGRGETVQWTDDVLGQWVDWPEKSGLWRLGENCVKWRIKPKTIKATINGVDYEFPEPLKEAPEGVEQVWYVALTHVFSVEAKHADYEQLGAYQLTKEGAEAQLRAVRALKGLV